MIGRHSQISSTPAGRWRSDSTSREKAGRPYHFYTSMYDHNRNSQNPEAKKKAWLDFKGFRSVNRGEVCGFLSELVEGDTSLPENHLKSVYLSAGMYNYNPYDLRNEFLIDENVYLGQEYAFLMPSIVSRRLHGEQKNGSLSMGIWRRSTVFWEYLAEAGDSEKWERFGRAEVNIRPEHTCFHFLLPWKGSVGGKKKYPRPAGFWRAKVYVATFELNKGEDAGAVKIRDEALTLQSTIYFTLKERK